MNSRKTLFSILFACFAIATTGWGQKFGHINSQQLLVESPKVKAADAQLETFQSGLIAKGESMVKAFEAEYKKYAADVQSNTLSPLQVQQRETALNTSQQSIQQYEVEVTQKIAMKREELYKPILDEVNVAIEAIGKEENFTMIFDTATNGLLFAQEGEDIMAKVKTRLGW